MRKFLTSCIRPVAALLLVSMLLFHCSEAALAAPQSYFLNVPIVGQAPKISWCWIASGTAVTNYYGNNITKDAFSIAAVGTANHDRPGSMSDVETGLQNWNISGTYANSSITFSSLKSIISGGHPCIAGRMCYYLTPSGTYGGVGHMYVITGYSVEYPNEQYIEVMDPAEQGTLAIMNYSEFCNYTSGSNYFSWQESLKNIY